MAEEEQSWTRDLWAFLLTAACALSWVAVVKSLVRLRILSTSSLRKLLHIGTGPIYLACWNLFTTAERARWLACLVPLGLTLKFAAVGLGLLHDPDTVNSMARNGKPTELLRGPFLYGMVFVATTVLFWGNSPTGICMLMLLCGGDGFAEVVGRLYGRHRLPHNPQKSWEGSMACFFFSILFQGIFLYWFRSLGWFVDGTDDLQSIIFWTSLVGAFVESLPVLSFFDNLTVPLSAYFVIRLLRALSFH
ncbi:Phosphatidate cytidylyltransferase [Balamuthia mandrillaris]